MTQEESESIPGAKKMEATKAGGGKLLGVKKMVDSGFSFISVDIRANGIHKQKVIYLGYLDFRLTIPIIKNVCVSVCVCPSLLTPDPLD